MNSANKLITENLKQWQTVKDAKAKDKLERRDCSH